MTVAITNSPEEPYANGELKLAHAVENGAPTRPQYEEGVNPVLETSKWAVEVGTWTIHSKRSAP